MNNQDELAGVLALLYGAESRVQRLAAEVISRYDTAHVNLTASSDVVSRLAPRTATQGRLLGRFGRRSGRRTQFAQLRRADQPPFRAQRAVRLTAEQELVDLPPREHYEPAAELLTVSVRLFVAKPGRWRYERLGEGPNPESVNACNGTVRWQVSTSGFASWPIRAVEDPQEVPEDDWRSAPSPVLREMLEPVLILSSLEIQEVTIPSNPSEPVGIAGRPRPAHITTLAAIVNPWADECTYLVEQHLGVILEARNLRDGREISGHNLSLLDTEDWNDKLLFDPPGN